MLHGAINAITLFASFLPSLLAGEVAFREDFRDDVTAHIPVTPNDLTSKFLGLKRLGPGADKLKLSYHPEIANDPHYIWNGECTGPTLIAFPFQKQLDLSASNWSLRLRTKNVGKSRLHLAVQVGQKWYVRKESIKNQKNWNVQSIPLHRPTWRSLNPTQVSFGDEVSNIDLTKVDALGFAAPLKPNRSKDCIRLDWFELIQGTTSLPPNGFLEPQTPFLRSALTFEHEGQKHSIPRGLLVPLGNGKSWACFDPDTLRWVVTWKAPSGNPPLTYDSMAAISFPNAKAKARRLPKLQGDILIVNPDTPESHSGHWLGTTLTDSGVEVHYELNGKRFTESASLEGENFVLIIHERGGASNKHTYDHNGRQTITKTSPRASRPANPTFPTVYRTKKTPPQNNGPFAVRNITFPQSPRPIRATDIAFLSSGTALLSTLDGDIWRITDLEKQNSTWTRVATGIFEPMAIEISADDKIYTLGRDQITELIDSNGDGHFDYFRNASDAFHQSSHTRDYATPPWPLDKMARSSSPRAESTWGAKKHPRHQAPPIVAPCSRFHQMAKNARSSQTDSDSPTSADAMTVPFSRQINKDTTFRAHQSTKSRNPTISRTSDTPLPITETRKPSPNRSSTSHIKSIAREQPSPTSRKALCSQTSPLASPTCLGTEPSSQFSPLREEETSPTAGHSILNSHP